MREQLTRNLLELLDMAFSISTTRSKNIVMIAILRSELDRYNISKTFKDT